MRSITNYYSSPTGIGQFCDNHKGGV